MKKSAPADPIFAAFTDFNNYYTEMPVTFLYEKSVLGEYEYHRMHDVHPPYSNSSEVLINATVMTARLPIVTRNGIYAIQYNKGVIECHDASFFASLLNLRLKLSPELFSKFTSIENLISVDERAVRDLRELIFKKGTAPENYGIEPMEILDKDLDLIKAWCKKNGYPFSIRQDLFAVGINKTLVNKTGTITCYLGNKLIKPNYFVSFWVWDFLRRLQILYSTFLLFYRIDGKDPAEANIEDRTFSNYGVEDCKRLLKRIFATISLKGILDFAQYEKGKKDMLIGYATANAFDLALYSLFLFMAVSGKSLRRCPLCLSLFEPENGRQKYCHAYKTDEHPLGTCYAQLNNKRKNAKKRQANK